MMRAVRLWRVAISVAVACVAVEAVLQLGAWSAWRAAWVGPHGPVDPAVVLVVGDGSVFEPGVATRAEAWPAEVEALGRATRADLRVVNGGAPERDSRGVLVRLAEQLDAESPGTVYLRVGVADLRRGTAEIVTDDQLRGRVAPFAIEFRLGALVGSWFAGSVTPAVADPAAGVLGSWHFGDVELTFAPAGRLALGTLIGAWRVEGGALEIMLPGTSLVPAELWREAGQDRLTVALSTGRITLTRGPRVAGASAVAEAAVAAGRWPEARWLLETAARSTADDPEALASLLELDVLEGRMDDAETRLAALTARDDPDGRAARLRALVALGRCREAADGVLAEPTLLAGRALLDARLRSMPDADQRERVRGLLAADPEPIGAAERQRRLFVLRSNLARAVELCRFHGSTPVLLAPEEEPAVHEVVEAVARELAVDLLSTPQRRSALRSTVLADLQSRLRS